MGEYKEIAAKLKEADAILIGASNGFSISEGLHIFAGNQAFEEVFGDCKRAYGIRNIPSARILSVLATLSACGASGVAGGSLLLIPLACSLFGIPNDVAMQVVGVGFIIGVIQDSVETALNSSSDLLLSASAEFRQWRKEGKEIKF